MTPTAVNKLKSDLRQQVRTLRRGLINPERGEMDEAIRNELHQYLVSVNVSSLSAFWPFDGEPDLRPALSQLLASGSTIALPVIDPDGAPIFCFHQWLEESTMTENRFSIPEPVDGPVVIPASLDCLLIPLVAWDRNGGRLGMGAGYYDRILAPLEQNDKPLRIGIAYGLQEVKNVPVSSHDVPLHGVICEHGWIAFNQ